MSSRDTKITRTLLESGLGLLAKKYEKNPSYGRTRTHDDMVPWALRALRTKMVENTTKVGERFSFECPKTKPEANTLDWIQKTKRNATNVISL